MTAFFTDMASDAPALTDRNGSTAPVVDDVERELVRRSVQGDPEAFRLLVERYQESIYRLCLRSLTCPEDAREAAQDTFVRAWRALPEWKPRASMGTWLFQIALNLCRDRIRHRQRDKRSGIRASESLETAAVACARPGPDLSATLKGDLGKLEHGLAALSSAQREVLILSALEGLSHQECAAILRCSPRAIEGRLYRARRELQEWWDRE